jgi:Ca2+/Na+ antiporter
MRRICTNKPPVSGGAARSVPRTTVSHILIGDLTLRWIVTILFGVSIATYVYILVAQHDRQTSTVNHLLHLTMSAAMIVMAWRVGMNIPTVGPMIFFLLAGVWFVRVAGRVSSATRDRLTNYYYAVKMAAMAWMYAMMNGSLPGQTGHSPEHALSGSLAMNMSGIDVNMSGTEMPVHEMSRTLPGPPGWITTVNWIAGLGFAVVALYWSCRFLAERRINPVPHATQLGSLKPLYQAFTAAGTALMFGALL